MAFSLVQIHLDFQSRQPWFLQLWLNVGLPKPSQPVVRNDPSKLSKNLCPVPRPIFFLCHNLSQKRWQQFIYFFLFTKLHHLALIANVRILSFYSWSYFFGRFFLMLHDWCKLTISGSSPFDCEILALTRQIQQYRLDLLSWMCYNTTTYSISW